MVKGKKSKTTQLLFWLNLLQQGDVTKAIVKNRIKWQDWGLRAKETFLFLNKKTNPVSVEFYPWIPKELVDDTA